MKLPKLPKTLFAMRGCVVYLIILVLFAFSYFIILPYLFLLVGPISIVLVWRYCTASLDSGHKSARGYRPSKTGAWCYSGNFWGFCYWGLDFFKFQFREMFFGAFYFSSIPLAHSTLVQKKPYSPSPPLCR